MNTWNYKKDITDEDREFCDVKEGIKRHGKKTTVHCYLIGDVERCNKSIKMIRNYFKDPKSWDVSINRGYDYKTVTWEVSWIQYWRDRNYEESCNDKRLSEIRYKEKDYPYSEKEYEYESSWRNLYKHCHKTFPTPVKNLWLPNENFGGESRWGDHSGDSGWITNDFWGFSMFLNTCKDRKQKLYIETNNEDQWGFEQVDMKGRNLNYYQRGLFQQLEKQRGGYSKK